MFSIHRKLFLALKKVWIIKFTPLQVPTNWQKKSHQQNFRFPQLLTTIWNNLIILWWQESVHSKSESQYYWFLTVWWIQCHSNWSIRLWKMKVSYKRPSWVKVLTTFILQGNAMKTEKKTGAQNLLLKLWWVNFTPLDHKP